MSWYLSRMETRWGLDLDMSAVRLMRRDGNAWSEFAVEKIDGPDIEDRLTAMIANIDTQVALFLPGEQILYTTVDLGPVGNTRAQIERAMDGRTPYALDELDLDWEMTASSSARVAAIALDTLDEAAAFAEVRGLSVSAYSSLATEEDFPRLPNFRGPPVNAMVASEAAVPVATDQDDVQFTTARKPSRPPTSPSAPAQAEAPIAPTPEATEDAVLPTVAPPAKPPAPNVPKRAATPDGPVVRVDNATPVMSVKSPTQPLNPGVPINAPMSPPRVRTDIAASTVSGSAASLTPPAASVKVRRGGSVASTAMIFAAAFLLTVGIAALVWTWLPLSPGSTPTPAPSAQSGENEVPIVPETEFAAAPVPKEAEIAVAPPLPEEVTAPEAPTEPEVTATETPEAEAAPEIALLPEEPEAPEPPIETVVEDVAPEVPDVPQPFAQLDIAAPELPEAGTAPQKLATLATAPTGTDAPRLPTTFRLGERPPAYDPNAPLPVTPSALAGIAVTAPFPGPEPDTLETTDDIYIASIESSELASDAIALPSIFGLSADDLPQISTAPSTDTEPAGLETAALVPDEKLLPSQEIDDAMAAAVAEALADALAGPAGLIPTKLASALPPRAPKARPGGFVEDIERDQFGGRTRNELSGFRPPPRPASAQSDATAAPAPPSELAIALSLSPRARPQNFGSLVTAARVQQEAERLSATVNPSAPDTSSAIEAALDDTPAVQQQPRLNIPTTASVARQATIENAIRLNKVNLVGVYGAVSDRRALVRLPSGRYVKVKVGDRVDGGTVAQITESQLLYRKGNRTLALEMPKG